MAKIIRTETRRRGFVGQICKWTFIAFNAFMIYAITKGLANVGEQTAHYTSEAQKAGAAIGATAGVSLLLGFWAAGDIVLGMLVFFTRGKISFIEERVES